MFTSKIYLVKNYQSKYLQLYKWLLSKSDCLVFSITVVFLLTQDHNLTFFLHHKNDEISCQWQCHAKICVREFIWHHSHFVDKKLWWKSVLLKTYVWLCQKGEKVDTPFFRNTIDPDLCQHFVHLLFVCQVVVNLSKPRNCDA